MELLSFMFKYSIRGQAKKKFAWAPTFGTCQAIKFSSSYLENKSSQAWNFQMYKKFLKSIYWMQFLIII